MRIPSKGRSFSNRSFTSLNTGIWVSAHSIRRIPPSASSRSLTSKSGILRGPLGSVGFSADVKPTWGQANLLSGGGDLPFQVFDNVDGGWIHSLSYRQVGGNKIAEVGKV